MKLTDIVTWQFELARKNKWLKERHVNATTCLGTEIKNENQKLTITHVINELNYFTSDDLEEFYIKTANYIQNKLKLSFIDSAIIGMAIPGKTCGSHAIIKGIQNKLPRDWEDKISTNFNSIYKRIENNNNIVLVDDFLGTGTKISEKRLKPLLDENLLQNKNIYIIVFAGMKQGIDHLKLTISESIYCPNEIKKCISQARISKKHREKFCESMLELEKNIFHRSLMEYSFGYGQSEASFCIESFNIPNNCFPILWWDKYYNGKKRIPLFTRG